MRKSILLMKDWHFIDQSGKLFDVNLPHTYNNIDGQDGGDDYFRGRLLYVKEFKKPAFDKDKECVYLEFEGVNASCEVILNGHKLGLHQNGYSTFRYEISPYLTDNNKLEVFVDNSKNEDVYPQVADFTFYGGIYRDVKLLILNKQHFDMDFYGTCGLKTYGEVKGKEGIAHLNAYCNSEGEVRFTIAGKESIVKTINKKAQTDITVENVHLWNGIKDPYLYELKAEFIVQGEVCDEVSQNIGFREIYIDREKGFFLNGELYPLHGVSRHQDYKGLGNAISYELMDKDMGLIKEIGANTIRLAHYQHNQYFYDLCDKEGMIVWAEIPYISWHMPKGNDNTILQMKELIYQNYHHPSIICWGISNEITIKVTDRKDMIENHHKLQKLCKELDPYRYTTMAAYAMCLPNDKVTMISDLVSWNLYLGWYVPFLKLNDLAIAIYHKVHPKQAFGYSEYGAEGMPNLHSSKPKRGDHSEEYQAKYHEFMLECFKRHPYMWSTYVWNMFDFAADARDQGGEAGMNHKGLVTFDRKIKKDSFYLYKAYWSKEPFVYIASRRYKDRAEKYSEVKIYTNEDEVKLYNNGHLLATARGKKAYSFIVCLEDINNIKAETKNSSDEISINKTKVANPDYKLLKKKKKSSNWV